MSSRFNEDEVGSVSSKGGEDAILVEENGLINLYVENTPFILSSYTETNEIVQSDESPYQLEGMSTPIYLESSDELKEFIEQCAFGIPTGGSGGSNTGGAGLFPTDVESIGGIAGYKQYAANTIPANMVLTEATVDKDTVRIHFLVEGGGSFYSPTVTVDGVKEADSITEDAYDRRLFHGYADVLVTETRVVNLTSSTGAKGAVTILRAASGPEINNISFGPYPNSQTELKAGDTISVQVIVENIASQVQILGQGASSNLVTLSLGGLDSGGIGYKAATGNIPIGSLSGGQKAYAEASNALGTKGNVFESVDSLILNQTYPSLNVSSVFYPNAQGAVKAGESVIINNTAYNYDLISYSANGFSVENPTTFEATKLATEVSSPDYVNSGNNLSITATRVANGAVTNISRLIKVSKVPPTASIAIVGSPTRLLSSVTGKDYVVRISASQEITSTIALNASIGTWQGAWTYSGGYWRRTLRILDESGKGNGLFSGLSITNLAGIEGTVITSGSNYVVGGFEVRTVTFPPFSQKVSIGTNVSNTGKVLANITGGSSLTFHADTGNYFDGFSVVDSGGNYDPNGDHLWLSDAAFAGSNVSGTLKCDIQEIE